MPNNTYINDTLHAAAVS